MPNARNEANRPEIARRAPMFMIIEKLFYDFNPCRAGPAEPALLREAERVSQRATTDDECIAAMRTAATMLRLIADDMDTAAIERAKISAPFPWPDKPKS